MRKVSFWIKIIPLVGLVLFALLIAARLLVVRSLVQRDLDALRTVEPLEIGETSKLEILPLYESVASDVLPPVQSGQGVSYLIETDTANILLDVGNNPTGASPSLLERNMSALRVTLDEIDMVVISHTHYDHVGGQAWQAKATFGIGGESQAPLGDRPIYVPQPLVYPGSAPVVVQQPRKIAEGVAVTGAIPYQYPFPVSLLAAGDKEQALVVNVRGLGAIVITGCGHMGLESLLAHTQAEFAEPVVGVVGGLHKGNASARALQPEFQLLEQLHPIIVALSPHDTSPRSLSAFHAAFPRVYVTLEVGLGLRISQGSDESVPRLEAPDEQALRSTVQAVALVMEATPN